MPHLILRFIENKQEMGLATGDWLMFQRVPPVAYLRMLMGQWCLCSEDKNSPRSPATTFKLNMFTAAKLAFRAISPLIAVANTFFSKNLFWKKGWVIFKNSKETERMSADLCKHVSFWISEKRNETMVQYFLSGRKDTITWIQTLELKEKLVIYLLLLVKQTQEAYSGQPAESGQHVT